METFWENILDSACTILKAAVVLLVLRGVIFLADIPMYVPFLDDIIIYFVDLIGYAFPMLKVPFS